MEGVLVVRVKMGSLSRFPNTHAAMESSQLLNWGSVEGSPGGGPGGFSRSTQYKTLCNRPSGAYSPTKNGFSTAIESGFINVSLGNFSSASFINAFQIGSAARILDPFLCMAALLLFPAQTPATSDGVYPTVHASRQSFEVPV